MQENEAKLKGTGRVTYSAVASTSLNQVLMRSINSTISSLLPVVALLIVGSFVMGAAALEEFALALTVGIIVGACLSILLASPVEFGRASCRVRVGTYVSSWGVSVSLK